MCNSLLCPDVWVLWMAGSIQIEVSCTPGRETVIHVIAVPRKHAQCIVQCGWVVRQSVQDRVLVARIVFMFVYVLGSL